jgi:hypothetical protein
MLLWNGTHPDWYQAPNQDEFNIVCSFTFFIPSREKNKYRPLSEVVSQIAPHSQFSALLLTRAHRVTVKSNALNRE